MGALLFQGTPIAHGFAEALSPLPGAGALSNKDFETGYGGTYTVGAAMVSAGGSLVFGVDRRLTDAEAKKLVLHVCGEAYSFSDASYDAGTHRYTWSGAGLDWSSLTSRTLRLSGPSDTTPPALRSSPLPRILATVSDLAVVIFDEVIDHDSLPPTSAFSVSADGDRVSVTRIAGEGVVMDLYLSTVIRQGQTVVLTYTDPTSGDDANAIQDQAGNDAASFTITLQNRSTVTGVPGKPAISGTARVGETLTASPGDIDDPNGVTQAVYTYQWIRVDGNRDRDISGATGEAYTLVGADEGKPIRVRASFVDDGGNAETRTSGPTEAVAVSVTAPRITIAPERPKATGRFDFIYYTLTREGSTSQAATVTVTLEPPAGNDWEIDADKIDHEVTFGAGEATKTLVILLKSAGFPHGVGFSNSATASGTLGARLGRLTGYDTTDTAEVEVVVVPDPMWIARLTQPAYVFIEDARPVPATVIEVEAASAAMPAPSRGPNGAELIEVSFSTDDLTGDGAATQLADYLPVSAMVPVRASQFRAGPDGVQRGQVAFSYFIPVQNSEPEGAERLLFVIERAPIVGIGQIHMEGPDGSRGRAGARYPVTIVEANTPATGAPGISGSGRAGETLRATTDAIADIDGVAGAAYRYRWIRVDGAHETRIGADSALYGPVAADIGKRVRVEVRFTDDLGFAEGPLASREVAIHAAMPPRVCPAPGSPGPGRVRLWEGAVGVGAVQVFKVPIAYGYYEGDPVLSPGGTLSPGEVSIGGEAYAVEGVYASTAGQLVFNLDGALSAMERAGLVLHVCGETYAFADAAHDPATDAYSWRNAGLDWSGVAERTVSLSTTRSPATGRPGIEGTGRIGETLTATTDDIADPDGLTGVEFSYQWVRIDAGTGTDIAGATERTYTVTAEDVFKAVRVRVGFTDDRSIAEEVTSAAFSIGNTPATGVPELRGSARVGRSMQAHTGGIVDPDGLTNAAFSYRWVRIDGTTETEVATGSRNYRAVAADEGTRIRVEVTFTDDLGTAEGPFASTPATVLDASPPPSTQQRLHRARPRRAGGDLEPENRPVCGWQSHRDRFVGGPGQRPQPELPDRYGCGVHHRRRCCGLRGQQQRADRVQPEPGSRGVARRGARPA